MRGVALLLASGSDSRGGIVYGLAGVVFLIVVFLLLASTNMQKELSHDEHMYIAAGDLLAREGLFPYKDYPFFQAPNLALVYAAIFQGTDRLLLAARLFNTLCSVLSLGILFFTASSLFRASRLFVRFSVSAGSVILLASSPVFVYTSGLAWNHDLPVLLTLLAVALLCRSVGQPGIGGRIFLAGVLVGSAIGTRLSFMPMIAPFIGGILLLPGVTERRKKLFLLAAFILGMLVALTPTSILFAMAPSSFAFDNVRYHQLNETYWQQVGYTRAMSFPGKLAYLGDVISEPATLALVIAFMSMAILVSIKAVRARLSGYFEFAFLLSLIPFLLAGAMAPTPMWYQYYYPLMPILVLSLVHGMSILSSDNRWRVWVLAAFDLLALISCASAVPAYLGLNRTLSISGWEPVKIHEVGLEIKRDVGEGKVLTLAPLYPLEGGMGIYKELATGPFAWRTANLLPGGQGRGLDIISTNDFEYLLRGEPPKAILVGFETSLEESMIKHAQEHSYIPEKLSNGATLWVAR